MDLKQHIATIYNYPKKGIIFRDINTLLTNPMAFKYAINELTKLAKQLKVQVIAAADARGFIIGAPIAYNLGIKFVTIRKKNKLPFSVYSAEYRTEYSTEILQMQKNVINKGETVLLVDDLLATGGTMMAMAKLVNDSQGIVIGAAFVININLKTSKQIGQDFKIYSLVNY